MGLSPEKSEIDAAREQLTYRSGFNWVEMNVSSKTLQTFLAHEEAQARRIDELEAGIRLIMAAATGKGHALNLIARECRALLPADTKEGEG